MLSARSPTTVLQTCCRILVWRFTYTHPRLKLSSRSSPPLTRAPLYLSRPSSVARRSPPVVACARPRSGFSTTVFSLTGVRPSFGQWKIWHGVKRACACALRWGGHALWYSCDAAVEAQASMVWRKAEERAMRGWERCSTGKGGRKYFSECGGTGASLELRKSERMKRKCRGQ